MAVEPALHELALVLGAVREPHDADPVGKSLLELSVVRGSVGHLEVAHPALHAVLVKVADEQAPVVVGVRAALA